MTNTPPLGRDGSAAASQRCAFMSLMPAHALHANAAAWTKYTSIAMDGMDCVHRHMHRIACLPSQPASVPEALDVIICTQHFAIVTLACSHRPNPIASRPMLAAGGLLLSGAQLRHAFKFVTPMLFDAFNGHLEAGSDRPVQRTDASSAGAINCMIVGGGVALRFNGRSKHIHTMLTSREVDVIKFIAVGALAGEHTDSMWWEREDVLSMMDADDNFEAPKAMKRSWARVVKSALN